MHDHNHQCACGHNQDAGAEKSKHECQCGHCSSSSQTEEVSQKEKDGCACGGHCGSCEEEKE